MHTSTPIARTPLHHWHTDRGARFADRDGWQTVDRYDAIEREVEAARSGLGVADISAFAKMSFRGPSTAELVRSFAPDSRAQHLRGVGPAGPGFLVCRLGANRVLLLQATSCRDVDWKKKIGELQMLNVPGLWTDVTSAYAGFLLVGPRLEERLRRLTNLDIRQPAFAPDTCVETSLAGVEALLVRCSGTPLPSLHVYVAWDLAEYVWEQIVGPGDLTPLGLEALALILRPLAA